MRCLSVSIRESIRLHVRAHVLLPIHRSECKHTKAFSLQQQQQYRGVSHSNSHSSSSSSSGGSSLASSSLEEQLQQCALRAIPPPRRNKKSVASVKKTTQAQARAQKGASAFHGYFRNVYGEERWETLGRALFEPTRMAALVNLNATTATSTTPENTTNVSSDDTACSTATTTDGVVNDCGGGTCTDEEMFCEWIEQKMSFQSDTNDETEGAPSTDSDSDNDTAAQQSELVVDRVSWANPLLAFQVNQGNVRLKPPSSLLRARCNVNQAMHVTQQRLPQLQKSHAGDSFLLDYYCLDPSSLLPVLALKLNEPSFFDDSTNMATNEPKSVLDMCAAPGGKTLAIMQALFLSGSHYNNENNNNNITVVANEMSRDRRRRLQSVLDEYVPREILQSSVVVTGHDGVAFGAMSSSRNYDNSNSNEDKSKSTYFDDTLDPNLLPFSHVLCDVPCSGERYICSNGRALGEWKGAGAAGGSSRRNQKRQVTLLKAAIAACRKGGTIVYSTCSIDPEENDGIIDRIFSKQEDKVDLLDLSFDIGERTKHGWIVLPDHPSCIGMGPMYIAALRRR